GGRGGGTGSGWGMKVMVAGQAGGATPTVSAPPDAVQFSGGFSYGSGTSGPLVSTGSANASVSATAGTTATATASAEVSSLSVFGGEITATSVVAHASATAKQESATGDASGSAVTGLVALRQPVATSRPATLADWGRLRTIEAGSSNSPAPGYHGTVTVLDIHLTADHGGLPAGTSILVGYAEVAALASPPTPVTPSTSKASEPKNGGKSKANRTAPEPAPGESPFRQPPKITPPRKTPG